MDVYLDLGAARREGWWISCCSAGDSDHGVKAGDIIVNAAKRVTVKFAVASACT